MQAQPHLIDPYARHGFNLGLRIYGMSSTMPGSAHDLKIVRRRMGLGKWERTMKDPDTSNDKRITIKGDKGFQGLEKSYPGAKIEIPDKKPKGRELDSQQKKKNRALTAFPYKPAHIAVPQACACIFDFVAK